MEEKGVIKIKKNKKKGYSATLILNNKPIPVQYRFDDDKYNEKQCEVETKDGQIVKLKIDGNTIIDKTVRETVQRNNISQRKGYDTRQENHSNKYSDDSKTMADSFDIKKTCLPNDTRELEIPDIDNFNLKLNKAARYELEKGRKKFKFVSLGNKMSEDDYEIKCNFKSELYKNLAKNLKHSIEKLNLVTEEMVFEPDWKIVSGIGNESVYEVSLLLHYIYGIPYLSGQSIKGVTRNYLIQKFFDNDEDTALKDEGFCKIFGSPKEGIIEENEGSVIFYDSFPLSEPIIKSDVMNSHFTNYYSKGEPPADYDKPNPIFFLTVSNTSFDFILASKKKNNLKIGNGKFQGKYPLEIVKEYLPEVLEQHGIGAKTSVGYGYMNQKR